MMRSTVIAGGSLVMCEDLSCVPESLLGAAGGALTGATGPGGGGSGPCCCGAIGGASAAHATIKSTLTPNFSRSLSTLLDMIPLILSSLLILIQSLLYLKIRCIEHEFRSPHMANKG